MQQDEERLPMVLTATIREGGAGDVELLADAFREMWLDNAVPAEHIEPDYRERVQQFVADGRANGALRFFIAERAGRCVGAACCQLFAGLYPAILRQDVRCYGYIWGVYVAPEERRQGLGQLLTETCVQALRARGCTHALLHAAPPGRGIYERLGFQGTNELRLVL
jgi:ribosomal protein S18 acetylase RimI-like enzyme